MAGPKHLIWFGTKARLTISEPELIREVLVTRAEHFDRYEAHPLICQFEGYGLSNLHGDPWARHRRVLAPAFHSENLKPLVPFVADTVRRMLDKLADCADANGGETEVAELAHCQCHVSFMFWKRTDTNDRFVLFSG